MQSVLNPVQLLRALVLVVLAAVVSGCATGPGRTTEADPFEKVNRGVYKFNDTLDRAALKPVAKGYLKVTPRWMRTGVSNFVANISYPGTIINQFLQGKVGDGFKDTGRLVANSTLGIGGLFDVASHMGLQAHDEDFGQTLAKWGVKSGPFITLPLFGPSSVRDAPSRIADYLYGIFRYVDVPWQAEWTVRGLDVLDTRAGLLSADSTLQQAFDPYAFTRAAWVQHREFDIFDGDPPAEPLDDLPPDDAPPPTAEPEKK